MTEHTPSIVKNERVSSKNNHLNIPVLIAIDLISIVFSLMPSVAAFSLTGLYVYYGYAKTWLVYPLAPLIFLAIFILIVALIRMCLPSLKPGRYKQGLNKVTFTWFCHLALCRSAKINGLISLLQSFNTFKYLYWRALGANVSFSITNSMDIDLIDCPLISIAYSYEVEQ